MTKQDTSCDAIVRVAIAIEGARVYELENTDPGAPEALRHRRHDLIELQHSIRPDYLPEAMQRIERPRLILLGGQRGVGKMAVLIASHTQQPCRFVLPVRRTL